MTEEFGLFNHLTLGGSPVRGLDLVWESEDKLRRLYRKGNLNERILLRFIAVEFVSCMGETKDHWTEDCELRVSNLFEATIHFDGVKHLEFNRLGLPDSDGYLYYPDMESLITMLQHVRDAGQLAIKFNEDQRG